MDFGIYVVPRCSFFINKRWNLKKMDDDLFINSLEFLATITLPGDVVRSPELYSGWLSSIMRDSCNISMPKVSITNKRRSAYWWSEEIANLRIIAIRARRSLTRNRRRVISASDRINYRLAKRALHDAIKKAKNKSWNELIASINKDPWGLPYKLVMGKLRRSCLTLSETINKRTLTRLLDTLFPSNPYARRPPLAPLENWDEEWDVDIGEIHRLVKRRPARNTAPGPDNLKSIIWKRVPRVILQHLASLFTVCLKEGIFPVAWKRALLVLIPKGPLDPAGEIKVRPICLLDEVGKILERVLADRINNWMDDNPLSSLSEYQFGFRKSRSTIDALVCVKNFIQEATCEGGTVIAVGLDITNAFNSVSWVVILRAIEEKGIPGYLCRMVDDHFG